MGWGFDGFKPDTGDVVGTAVAFAGVLIIMLWPRALGETEAVNGDGAHIGRNPGVAV